MSWTVETAKFTFDALRKLRLFHSVGVLTSIFGTSEQSVSCRECYDDYDFTSSPGVRLKLMKPFKTFVDQVSLCAYDVATFEHLP
jgi:hypothetical protein